MPIKTVDTSGIPLLSFIPFTLPTNTILAENIDEMFSVNLEIPDPPFEIDYLIGDENVYKFNLSVKNLTENAQLNITIEYNPEIFVVDNPTTILNANQIATFNVTMNSERLDTINNKVTFEEDIKVVVSNVNNNTVVYKQINSTALPPTVLPTI